MNESRDIYESDADSRYGERTIPDLDESLSNFSPNHHRSPFYGIPSSYSGFRSGISEPEAENESVASESVSHRSVESTWGPLARHWYKNRNEEDARSRSSSKALPPPHQILLPLSRDQTPRSSPDRDVAPNLEELSVVEEEQEEEVTGQLAAQLVEQPTEPKGEHSFVRFALRAEMQQRTEHIDNTILWIKRKYDAVTETKLSMATSTFVVIIGWMFLRGLLGTAELAASPDLVMVAQLTKSYEPLMHYTEEGHRQVNVLQDTSVAVWDLGETIRQSNMTSGPIIFRELEDLSDNLLALSDNLNAFLGHVTSDVDHILTTMDWAKRELTKALSRSPNFYDSIHDIFSRVGLLERGGQSTKVGTAVTELFGQTVQQKTMLSLHRTFNEFLNAMERSINDQLNDCSKIFTLFETIDGQFLNLQRTVIREKDQQEREESEVLASLWHRLLGSNSAVDKFEKNKRLLSTIKDRTVKNKHILISHHGQLLTTKANLEGLRRRLFSPLVRGNASSTLSVAEQVTGLAEIHEYLERIREGHKTRMREDLRVTSSQRYKTEAIDGR